MSQPTATEPHSKSRRGRQARRRFPARSPVALVAALLLPVACLPYQRSDAAPDADRAERGPAAEEDARGRDAAGREDGFDDRDQRGERDGFEGERDGFEGERAYGDPEPGEEFGAPAQREEDIRAEWPDRSEIMAVVEGFHEALMRGDTERALDLLHPDVVVFEGGQAEGLYEYRSGHLAADMEFSEAVRRIPLNTALRIGSDRSVWLSEYRMRGWFRGRDIDTRGTETMVLVQTPEGWKIQHIHWSSE